MPTPGLPTTPAAGLNPALTSPAGLTPGVGTPGEVPISAPLDPGVDGTYPILGDPSTLGGTSPVGGGSGSGSGGLVNDVMQAANQLGAGQAIDLLKGLVMPAIAQAQGGAGLPGAAGALPGAAGALPGAAGALPGAAAALPHAAGALPAAGAALPAAGAALPAAGAALPPALPPV
ncbi:hypothetical protein H7I03_09600 [Mycobacterium sherrisii]|nr:hypothetical protein [Mycobacterium sherrisii]